MVSLLTGLRPSAHGVQSRDSAIPAALPVLPEMLRAAGYRTAAIVTNAHLAAAFGFDRGCAWQALYELKPIWLRAGRPVGNGRCRRNA